MFDIKRLSSMYSSKSKFFFFLYLLENIIINNILIAKNSSCTKANSFVFLVNKYNTVTNVLCNTKVITTHITISVNTKFLSFLSTIAIAIISANSNIT